MRRGTLSVGARSVTGSWTREIGAADRRIQSVEIGGQVFVPCVLEHASNLVREDAFRR
jgi:hypothetical protein